MDVQSEAKELHANFDDDLDISVDEVESKMESFIEFGVKDRDEVVNSTISKLTAEYDVDRSELVGEGGSSGDGYPETNVEDINEADQWVTITAQVTTLWDNDTDSIAQVGLMDDGTGTIKFLSWAKSEAPRLQEGGVYKLKGVVTDEYNGDYEVKINSQTEVEMVDEELDLSSDSKTVTGAIVSVQNGSGLIKRCSEDDCNNRLKEGSCDEHGDVDSEFDLRLMAVLDTGETTYTAVLNREQTEELTGIGIEKAEEIARTELNQDAVLDEMLEQGDILGNYYTVTGNLSGDWIFADEVERATEHEETAEGLLVKARAL